MKRFALIVFLAVCGMETVLGDAGNGRLVDCPDCGKVVVDRAALFECDGGSSSFKNMRVENVKMLKEEDKVERNDGREECR